MWVIDNNQFLGERESWSRAEQFGDGLFETMAIKNGVVAAVNLHAKRLEKGLKRLKINLPSDDVCAFLLDYIKQMTTKSGMQNGVLKVIVSRGYSARGYGFDKQAKPRVTAFYSSYQAPAADAYENGIVLGECETQCAIQSQLAGLKHLNRLENVLAKAELQNGDFEGVMKNHLGFVIEGTMSNVFFEKDSVLFTPSLLLSGVEGIMRQLIIKYCQKNNIALQILDINMQAPLQFDGAFICNSVMGILPVKKITNESLSIGLITRQLQSALSNGWLNEELAGELYE